MYLLFDGDLANPEIELSAPAEVIVSLGKQLKELNYDLEITTDKARSDYYSESLESIIFKIFNISSSNNNSLFAMKIKKRKLYITGSQEKINDLGISILNMFSETSQTNKHLHLDYFEGSIQKASLIILCRDLAL